MYKNLLLQSTSTYLTVFLAQTRLAALNLLELILSKMNGDIQRLSRICGSSLSDKATFDIEEKWNKRNQAEVIPSPVPIISRFLSHTYVGDDRLNGGDFKSGSEDRLNIRDELPAFRLDTDPIDTAEREKDEVHLTKAVGEPGHFSFPIIRSGNITEEKEEVSASERCEYIGARDLEEDPGKADGTAASLRMRLLEIKEKSKIPDESFPVEDRLRPFLNVDDEIPTESKGTLGKAGEFTTLRSLLKRKGPLPEHDYALISSIDVLKKIHAALSKQGNSSLGLSYDEIFHFRSSMAVQIDALVDLLTRYVLRLTCKISPLTLSLVSPYLD